MTTDCTYCGETVSDDQYHNHLRQHHFDDLSTIDRRRVGEPLEEPTPRNYALYASAGLVLVLFIAGYAVLFTGIGGNSVAAAIQPDSDNLIHEHGTIIVEHDGEVVDFNDPQYVERDGCFHFHGYDNAELWHAHCENVTIEYALATLGIELTGDTFVIDDTEYSADDPDVTLSVTANGEPVDPQEYVLQGVGPVEDAMNGDGDEIRVVVEVDE